MSLTVLKVGKQEFVLVPKRRFERMSRLERDQKDAEIARRAMEAYDKGTLKTITHEALMKKLGLRRDGLRSAVRTRG